MSNAKQWILGSLLVGTLILVSAFVVPRLTTTCGTGPEWPHDLNEFTPGKKYPLEPHEQDVYFQIPPGESVEHGTFSVVPAKGKPLSNIPRPGRWESFFPVYDRGNDGTSFLFLVRDGSNEKLAAILVWPVGYDYRAMRLPDPPSRKLYDADVRVWGDRVAAHYRDVVFEYRFKEKEWKERK